MYVWIVSKNRVDSGCLMWQLVLSDFHEISRATIRSNEHQHCCLFLCLFIRLLLSKHTQNANHVTDDRVICYCCRSPTTQQPLCNWIVTPLPLSTLSRDSFVRHDIPRLNSLQQTEKKWISYSDKMVYTQQSKTLKRKKKRIQFIHKLHSQMYQQMNFRCAKTTISGHIITNSF